MWLLALSLLHAAPDAPAGAPEAQGTVWATRTEGAAVRVREAAGQLAETANEVAASGRVQQLGVLHSDVDEVVKRADALVLWSKQAPSASD